MTNAETAAQAPVAVIGYGTAGVNALIGLRNGGYTGPVDVFSNIEGLPYSPILTSYYAGGEKTREQCFPWTAEELAELGANVREACPVTKLDIKAHLVCTPQGEFPYSKCVIASGSRPVPVGFPKAEGFDPMGLRTMDDAQRLKDVLEDERCRKVLISGASMVALKTLESCLNCGKQATLVGMNQHVLDFNALPEAAERFERGLRSYGVELRLGMTAKELEVVEGPGIDGKQYRVTFSNGDVDTFDAIAVAHGMRSNLEFLEEGALEMDRAILVDEHMRSSDPDVYAAGDVAQALELISGERRIVGIWKNAAVQGQCAGAAIAAEMSGRVPGDDIAFKGAIPTNTICVKDTLFISAGTMQLSDERYVETRETDDMIVMYIWQREEGGRRLVGFNIACDHDEAGSVAYDTGAMLSLQIERGCREAAR